jgi:general secretion pathway protein E
VVAQRLVRVLNPDTRIGYPAGDYESKLLGVPSGATLYRPGADAGSGYRGRTGIYELVIVNDRMRVMIHDGAGEHELERAAREVTPGIRDDGRAKVLAGQTSLEELFRVAREE